MAVRDVPLRRWARLSLAAAVPLGLAFLVLGALGLSPPVAAALAWAGLSLLAAVVIGLMLADVGAVARHAESSAESGGDAERDPVPAGLFTRELAASVERLARTGAEDRSQLASERAELERALDALPEPLLLLDSDRRIGARQSGGHVASRRRGDRA